MMRAVFDLTWRPLLSVSRKLLHAEDLSNAWRTDAKNGGFREFRFAARRLSRRLVSLVSIRTFELRARARGC